jgi:hypothetical protein
VTTVLRGHLYAPPEATVTLIPEDDLTYGGFPRPVSDRRTGLPDARLRLAIGENAVASSGPWTLV